MQVVPLHPKMDCEGIATALRNIADQIEAGNYDFDPTLAVLVLGRESERKDIGGITMGFNWQTHGLGKCGFFAAKGLLGVALARFETGGEK